MLTIEELREQVERGEIDTVVAAFTDMQGRLLGKREHAEFFLEESAEHGVEGCNYLLALDMEMDPQAGYAMASWEQDYHILATTFDEPLIRRIRNSMSGAGIRIESSKGEAWPGQQEINLRYADALTMADNHTVYKNGAKEIAHQNGCSITFMAKPDHSWIGSSCHIHSSLWRNGANAFEGESQVFRRYLAGWIACLRELALFLAPTINSYKRYAAGSWGPTSLAWGTTTAPAASASSGTGRRSGSRRGSPAATSTPTSRSRH